MARSGGHGLRAKRAPTEAAASEAATAAPGGAGTARRGSGGSGSTSLCCGGRMRLLWLFIALPLVGNALVSKTSLFARRPGLSAARVRAPPAALIALASDERAQAVAMRNAMAAAAAEAAARSPVDVVASPGAWPAGAWPAAADDDDDDGADDDGAAPADTAGGGASSDGGDGWYPASKLANLRRHALDNLFTPTVNLTVTMCYIAPFPDQEQQLADISRQTGSRFLKCGAQGNFVRFERAPFRAADPSLQGVMHVECAGPGAANATYAIVSQTRDKHNFPPERPYADFLEYAGPVEVRAGVDDTIDGNLLLAATCNGELNLHPVVVRSETLARRARRFRDTGLPWHHAGDPLPGTAREPNAAAADKPNVVFLLMDSLSRANWMRQMTHTSRLLRAIDWTNERHMAHVSAAGEAAAPPGGDADDDEVGDDAAAEVDDEQRPFVAYQFGHFSSTATYTPGNEFPMLSGYDTNLAGRFAPPNSMHTWLHEYAREYGLVVGEGHAEDVVRSKHNRNGSPSVMWRPWSGLTGFQREPAHDHEMHLPAFGYKITLRGKGSCSPEEAEFHPNAKQQKALSRKHGDGSDGRPPYWHLFLKDDTECTQCLGNRQATDAFYAWALDFMSAYADVPKYTHVSSFEAHQASPAAGKQFDEELAAFLRAAMADPRHANTVFVLAADHGVGYPPTTSYGWGMREVMLPFLNVVVPRGMLRRRPELAVALAENTLRMVTMYDLHFSLIHLFDYPRFPDAARFFNNTAPGYEGPHAVYSVFNASLPFQRSCESARVSVGKRKRCGRSKCKDPLVCACQRLPTNVDEKDYQMSPTNMLTPIKLN